MGERVLDLETWTVATCNVVIFGLVLVLLGHAGGVLADALSGAGTLPGLLVFGYLWGVVSLGTRWALAEDGLRGSTEGALTSLLTRGAVAGAAIGSTFLVGVALVAGGVGLLAGQLAPLSLLLVVLLGGGVSAVVGAVVGVVFVLVDATLYRAVDVLVPPPAG